MPNLLNMFVPGMTRQPAGRYSQQPTNGYPPQQNGPVAGGMPNRGIPWGYGTPTQTGGRNALAQWQASQQNPPVTPNASPWGIQNPGVQRQQAPTWTAPSTPLAGGVRSTPNAPTPSMQRPTIQATGQQVGGPWTNPFPASPTGMGNPDTTRYMNSSGIGGGGSPYTNPTWADYAHQSARLNRWR